MALNPLFDDLFDGNLLDLTILNGGVGDDLIVLDNGNDESFGDDGNDLLFGNDGTDTLKGGNDDDQLFGGKDADTLEGDDGNDQLDGGAGIDNMSGGTGDDTFIVDNSSDVAVEGLNEGTDNVLSSVSYRLGDNIENLFLTGIGNITGTGNLIANNLIGNDGNNNLGGLGGNDTLLGGIGNDSLFGGGGNDIEDGGAGNDLVVGGTGNDALIGSEGLDRLVGHDGNDVLVGGLDKDSLSGGTGNDAFRFTEVTDSVAGVNRDVILDFVQGVDIIDLSAIDADTSDTIDSAFQFRGTGAFTGGGEIKLLVMGRDLLVRVELEGDGNFVTDMEIQLTGAAAITLAETDFAL